MRFLIPAGGIVDNRFGILTSPSHKGVPAGIVAGMEWGAENENYTKGFDPDVFFNWLEKMEAYRESCLFVPVPDIPGDAAWTLVQYYAWRSCFYGWPVAYVAQDGQEDLPFPDGFDVLFIGGTTDWKLGNGATSCIYRALHLGKRIHIGRVNWVDRYDHFDRMTGSQKWTCDGTRNRFDGVEKTVKAWAGYMERSQRQVRMSLFDGHCDG
jgi:hypothetical protein